LFSIKELEIKTIIIATNNNVGSILAIKQPLAYLGFVDIFIANIIIPIIGIKKHMVFNPFDAI